MFRVSRSERGWAGDSAPKTLLVALLLLDALFIASHLLLWRSGHLHLSPDLNIEIDNSVPELYNQLKWLACFLICAWQFIRIRDLP